MKCAMCYEKATCFIYDKEIFPCCMTHYKEISDKMMMRRNRESERMVLKEIEDAKRNKSVSNRNL